MAPFPDLIQGMLYKRNNKMCFNGRSVTYSTVLLRVYSCELPCTLHRLAAIYKIKQTVVLIKVSMMEAGLKDNETARVGKGIKLRSCTRCAYVRK